MRNRTIVAVLFLALASMASDGTWFVNQMSYGVNGLRWSNARYWLDGVVARDGGTFTYLSSADSITTWISAGVFQDIEGLEISGMAFPNSGAFLLDGDHPITFVGDAPYLHPKDQADKYVDQKISFLGANNGFTKTGRNTLRIYNDATYSGFTNVTFKHGPILVYTKTGTAITDDRVTFEGNEISFVPELASDSDARLTIADSAAIELKGSVRFNLKKGSNTSAALTIGNIVRSDIFPGTLYLSPEGGWSTIGLSEKFMLKDPAPLVHAGSGMVSPVIAIGGPDAANTPVCFARHDALNGLVPATNLYHNGFGGADQNSIVYIAANTTLAEDKTIHALVIDNDAVLTINPGVTLTIGDGATPAGIIVQGVATAKRCISGGTIDFRGSEGIIWMQDNTSTQQTIDTEVYGTAGVTVTGRKKGGLVSTKLQGRYANSGDLRIYWGRLELEADLVDAPSIQVFGDRITGGQLLCYTQTPVAELTLAGFGINTTHGRSAFTGTGQENSTNIAAVVLADDTGIRLNRELRLDCPVSGPGGLFVVQDNSKLTLNGANTYQGMTKLDSGTLELGPEGTFGLGAIENNTTITLQKSGAFIVSNQIYGTGSWIKNTEAALIFANPQIQIEALTTQGDIEIAGRETGLGLLAQSVDRAITPVSTGAESPAMAGIGSTADAAYSGYIRDNGSSAIGLTKTGSGTLTIAKPQNYSGPTLIREGTLRLIRETIPCEAEIAYHLDATDAATIKIDAATGEVTNWIDRVSGINFKKRSDLPCPAYADGAAGGINALPAIYFNGWTNSLAADKEVVPKTVLIMFQTAGHSIGGQGYDCIWAVKAGDWGSLVFRLPSASSIECSADEGNHFIYSTLADMSINGVNGVNRFTPGTPTLLSSFRAVNINAGYNVLGNNHLNRSLCGYIGEVIAFERVLTPGEIKAVENYMWQKWMGSELHEDAPNLATGSLPNDTALTIAPDAVLDLNGIDQRVGTLAGNGGTIINSSGQPATLTVMDANTFRGIVGTNVNLVLQGAAETELLATSGSTITLSGPTQMTAYNERPPQDGVLYWLDAADAATVQRSTDGYVTNWISKAGIPELAFGLEKPSWDQTASQPPTYTGSINGLDAVFFSDTNNTWLKSNTSISIQTLVMVFQTIQNQMGNAGYWGYNSGTDVGLRGGGVNLSYSDVGNCFVGASAWVNGAKLADASSAFSYTLNTPVTVRLESPAKVNAGYNSIGGYHAPSASDTRRFRGAVGEVIAYDRMLAEGERSQLERYLTQKWRTPDYTVATTPFAGNAELILAAGASLNMQGAPLCVARLTGGGAITGSVTVTESITVVLDANGACLNPLSVIGSLTLSQARLFVDGVLRPSTPKVRFADATGTITGLPSWDDPPPGWQVIKEDSALYLYKSVGTLILVR